MKSNRTKAHRKGDGVTAHTPPHVALLIETSRGFGRQLLQGIAHYSHLHGPWSFYITPGDFKQAVPMMRRWGRSTTARVADQRIEQAIIEANVPTIVVGLRDRQLQPDSLLFQAGQILGNDQRVGNWRRLTCWSGTFPTMPLSASMVPGSRPIANTTSASLCGKPVTT